MNIQNMNSNHNQQQPQPHEPQSQKYSGMNEVIEKMLLNIESRYDECHQRQQNSNSRSNNYDNTFGSSVSSQPKKLLSNHELDKLSLLCTSTFNTNASITPMDNYNGTSSEGQEVNHHSWMNHVNVDSISDLCMILKNHVINATKVDYISYARSSFDQSVNGDDNNSTSTGKAFMDRVRSQVDVAHVFNMEWKFIR